MDKARDAQLAPYADRLPDPAMRRAAYRWLGLMAALIVVCLVLIEASPYGAVGLV